MLFEDIEPTQFVGVDTFESQGGVKYTIGDGGLFQQNMQSLVNADDAFAYGTCISSKSAVNTPYGLFWVSQQTGKIINYSGGGMDEISKDGMKHWFLENLPSPLLKKYPDFKLYDNVIEGISVQSIFDSQYDLLYFTKKDYIASEMWLLANKMGGSDKQKMLAALDYFIPFTENYNRDAATKLSLNKLDDQAIQDWLMVLMRDTASAPPALAARAGRRTSVMLGVSFTMTGSLVYSLHQAVTIWMYSGTWPTAAPMPRSLMPCGQPKFSSMASAPVSSTRGRMAFQLASTQGTMMDTTMARSGHRRLTSAISRKFVSRSRSVISSMLLKPYRRRSGVSSAP